MFFGDGERFHLAAPRSCLLVGCTQILLSRFYPGKQGRRHGFEGGGTILRLRRAKKNSGFNFQVHRFRMFGLRVGVNPEKSFKQKKLRRSRIGL